MMETFLGAAKPRSRNAISAPKAVSSQPANTADALDAGSGVEHQVGVDGQLVLGQGQFEAAPPRLRGDHGTPLRLPSGQHSHVPVAEVEQVAGGLACGLLI